MISVSSPSADWHSEQSDTSCFEQTRTFFQVASMRGRHRKITHRLLPLQSYQTQIETLSRACEVVVAISPRIGRMQYSAVQLRNQLRSANQRQSRHPILLFPTLLLWKAKLRPTLALVRLQIAYFHRLGASIPEACSLVSVSSDRHHPTRAVRPTVSIGWRYSGIKDGLCILLVTCMVSRH